MARFISFSTRSASSDGRQRTRPMRTRRRLSCRYSAVNIRNDAAMVPLMASTRGERLRAARKKHFRSARAAAVALGIPVATYNSHERAEHTGGRDYGPEEAQRYARRFGVTPEWLLTGYGGTAGEHAEISEPPSTKLRVRGYVGAKAQVHLYDVAPENLDEVETPPGLTTASTVAVEVRDISLGAAFRRWLVLYDDLREPVNQDLNGVLCVIGLKDGRTLVKQLQQLEDEPAILWATKVKAMLPR
jgi:hypothetical protein